MKLMFWNVFRSLLMKICDSCLLNKQTYMPTNLEGVQKTYCNMAASEKLIRDGSISVLFMCDAREVT